MITVKKLKELLSNIPDDVGLIAYEGESCGISLFKGDSFGWIETGWDHKKNYDDKIGIHDLGNLEIKEGEK